MHSFSLRGATNAHDSEQALGSIAVNAVAATAAAAARTATCATLTAAATATAAADLVDVLGQL